MKRYSIILLMAFGLGAFMPLGFAPFSFWPLPLVLLSIFLFYFYHNDHFNLRFLSFFYGLSFGLGFFTVGISWISISLYSFGGAPLFFAALATFAVILLMASYYAIFITILNQIRKKHSLHLSLAVAAPLWMIFEYLRATLFTGFPWLALGYNLVDSPIKYLILPQMGALMGSFWIMWLACLLCIIYLAIANFLSIKKSKNLFDLKHPKASKNKPLLFLFPAIIMAITMIFTYLKSDDITELAPIKVEIVQGNIPINTKFAEDKFWDNTQVYVDLTQAAFDRANPDQIPDIIIWPETAIASFYNSLPGLFDHLREWMQLNNRHLITGLATGDANSGDYRNAIIHIGDAQDHFYEKHRLLPFGEYLPLRGIFSIFKDYVEIPLDDFTPGPAIQAPFKINHTFIGSSICFEGVFGQGIRYQAKEASVLVNISNDAWFGRSLAPFQHFQIIKARAIELSRPLVRATNTGVSGFINAKGEVDQQAELFTSTSLFHEVTPTEGLTAYAKWGDLLWLYLSILLIIIMFTYAHFARTFLARE